MPRLITIECDANEVRVAVGTSGLTGVSVERVLSSPISIEENTEPWGSPSASNALKELLNQSGIKSGDAIACISRNDIELRAITLPLVDANELPDMVRFAAPRYFANVSEAWPLDFITMPSHMEGSIDCIVGAINPSLIQKIASTVEGAGLTLTHMVLRPMAAAAGAIAKHPEWNNETVMFIDLLNDETDVVVVEKGNAVFMRNFQAPFDATDPQTAISLAGEIKRTIFSAISQRPGLSVSQIVIWTKDSLAPFATELSKAVNLPVKMLDPFSMAEKAKVEIAATTQTVGRFAPVLGALHFPQESRRLIDFANPRKRVEKKRPIAKYIAAGAAGVAAIAGGLWWYSSSHSALDDDIRLLNESIKNQTEALKAANKNISDWSKVEKFIEGDVLWIEELAQLSAKAQSPDETYFGTTTFLLEPKSAKASISAKYYAKDQDTVPEVQAGYRDPRHTVKGQAVTISPDKNYPAASDLMITIASAKVTDPRDLKRPEKPHWTPMIQNGETSSENIESTKTSDTASDTPKPSSENADTTPKEPTSSEPTSSPSAPASPATTDSPGSPQNTDTPAVPSPTAPETAPANPEPQKPSATPPSEAPSSEPTPSTDTPVVGGAS
jgi:Tfp pilus assembly PilM family ATPase